MDELVAYLGQLSDPAARAQMLTDAQAWATADILTVGNLIQIVIVGLAFLVARILAPRIRAGLGRLTAGRFTGNSAAAVSRAVGPLTLPLTWLALQWLSLVAAAESDWPNHLLRIAVSLLTAWIIIRLASRLVRDPTWAKAIAITAWSIAALNIVGLLDDTIVLLDGIALQVGDVRFSVLSVLKGMLSLAVLLWAATLLSGFMERRIRTLPNLTPSVQVLFSKILKIALITIAIVLAISSVGIDLTAFAVFGGAIGVGIGFGLQKVVSNLISGVILLVDKSIKPGDVIEVGETYGWINSLGARYASVVTRDGTEYLIPNEDLITQQVVNWSFSNNEVRLKIPIGVSYKADVRRAIELCKEAAAAVDRVVDEPKPACLLKGFGDSSVDLELRFWIEDAQNGVSNVRSEVLLLVWDKFHEHGIEIPFPQRDVHIIPPADAGAQSAPGGGVPALEAGR